jgi:hypothetical protein
MKILGYYFRSARLDPILERHSETIVIFVHGVLSKSKDAFRLYKQEGYFWDIIKDVYPFSSFDMAMFSYGRFDASYILEKDWPINNLTRISVELHGAISKYKNVIFLSHSQGGLLAKTYSSLYCLRQGVFLVTLHTPHRNKSITVMRVNDNKIWDDSACFHVSHMFCGSINDNKIVKPDNALTGCKDIEYISYDKTKESLGHSHLSQSPDPELIRNLQNHAEMFINSGLNKKFYIYPGIAENEGSNVELIFSRSHLKLKKYTGKDGSLFESWEDPYFRGETGIIPNEIFQNGCSVNYFLRYLKNTNACNVLVSDLDKVYPDDVESVGNKLCELCFGEERLGQNPYKNIPFFTRDFPKKSLIINDDFFELFLKRLQKEKTKNTDLEGVCKAYKCAVKDYRRVISNKIYRSSLIKRDMSEGKFEVILFDSVKKLLILPEKKSEYLVVHEIVKKKFYDRKYRISLRDIEAIVSVLMRSDGELYWLDRDVRQVFKYKE